MSKLTAFATAHAQALRAAFRHAPFEAGLGVLVAGAFSVAVAADDSSTWEVWARLAMASAVLLPALLCLTIPATTGRLGRARWAFSGAAVAGAGLFAAFGLDPDDAVANWRWGLSAAAAWSVLLLAPVSARRADDAPRAWFWTANSRLASRIAVVALFTGALYLGLAGALAAVETLFGLDFREDPYLHLFGAVFFGLVPSLVVGDLPEVLAPVGGGPGRASRMVRWLGAYLIVPLLLTYVVILYAYNVKVLLSGEMPHNVLSPLALGAAAFGMLGALVTDPLQEQPDPPASVRLLRWFPAYFLALLPLPAWAVLVRVEQYGWTEFRYVRMLALVGATVYCVVGAVRLGRRGPAPIAAIPATFGALFAVAAVGGPLSATGVGISSQTSRLVESLGDAGLWTEAGALDMDARCPSSPEGGPCGQVYGSASYLVDRLGDARVREILHIAGTRDTLSVLADLGVQPWYGAPVDRPDRYVVQAALPLGTAVPGVPGGEHRRVQAWRNESGSEWSTGDVRAGLNVAPPRLELRASELQADVCVFDLADLLGAVASAHAASGAQPWASVDLAPGDVLVPGAGSGASPCGVLLVDSFGAEAESGTSTFSPQSLEGRWIR